MVLAKNRYKRLSGFIFGRLLGPWCVTIEVKKAGIQQPCRLDFSHRGEQCFFEERMLFLEVTEEIAQGPANRPGFLRAAARNDWCACARSVCPREIFCHVDERPNEPEFAFTRPGHRWQRADAPGEHRIAEERFAEIVGSVAECDYVCTEPARDFVHSAATIATTKIASVVGFLGEQVERWSVLHVSPVDTARPEILADRLYRREELALFNGERADVEIDGRALLQNQQRFEQRHGILAAGHAYGDAISIADHAELADGFADLAKNCFFEIQLISG
jgi:hypothetical protein